MMELTRIIHPIGQGGFYTEKLSNGNSEINVVYDCGGFDKKGNVKMEKYLQSYLSKDENVIDVVFISHLHADHINGLSWLLKNKKIKYLVLPQLTDNVMFEAMVYNYCFAGVRYSLEVNELIMQLHSGKIENVEKILQLKEWNDSDSLDLEGFGLNENFSDLIFIKGGNVIPVPDDGVIDSGTLFLSGKWLYIPFNPPCKNKDIYSTGSSVPFSEYFKKQMNLSNLSVNDLLKKLSTLDVKLCKTLYTEYFGENYHNSYSMTLFSGTDMRDFGCYNCSNISRKWQNRTHCYHHLCGCLCNHVDICNPNMLYTGDFEPKNKINKLQNFYQSFIIDRNANFTLWESVASIQVPHHGSKDNYHNDLYEHAVRGYVSVGNDNYYKHPDLETLTKIVSKGCRPIVVTEDKSSIQIQHYKF